MRIKALSVAMMIGLVSGCVTPESRWSEVRQQDTITGYQEYITQYPNAAQSVDARKRVEQLKFDQAKAIGTSIAVESYLSEYPSSANAAEARKLDGALSFKEAHGADTADAYSRFIARFPNDPLAANARILLAQTKAFAASKHLGELAIRMAPKYSTCSLLQIGNFQAAQANSGPPALEKTECPDLPQCIGEFRQLLDGGADPNAVRILGFEPGGKSPTGSVTARTVVRNGQPYILLPSGKPGQVVPPSRGGMTLLEYCMANGLTGACDLLKAHAGRTGPHQ
jgi:hypothetical protein